MNNNLDEELINILENEFSSNKKIESLINHFSRTCYFCDKIGKKIDHETFLGRNGLPYYEYHHFILQKIADKKLELEPIVQNPSNGLCLCSNCHNKFHYGTIEDIKKMIETVLDDDKVLDKTAKKTIIDSVESIKKEEDILVWLLNEYLSR